MHIPKADLHNFRSHGSLLKLNRMELLTLALLGHIGTKMMLDAGVFLGAKALSGVPRWNSFVTACQTTCGNDRSPYAMDDC